GVASLFAAWQDAKSRLDAAREALENAARDREWLEHAVGELRAFAAQPGEEEELATEREADEVLEGMGLSGQQEIRMIEAALARVAEGNYGICVNCGNDIGDARLDVLPFTPFCRDCAA
ncbi:MAG: hypothetical protein RLZZ563_2438, partial [Pseudomonadota bacterium]